MINQQILDYIRQQLAAGISKDVIIKTLETQGWAEQDVAEAFVSIEKITPPPSTPVPPTPAVASVVQPEKSNSSARLLLYGLLGLLIGIVGDLIIPSISHSLIGLLPPIILTVIGGVIGHYLDKKIKPTTLAPARKILATSFTYFRANLGVLLGIWAVPLAFTFIGMAITLISPSPLFTIGLIFVSAVLSVFINLVAFASTIWAITRPAGEGVTIMSSYKAGLKSFFSVLWIWFLTITAMMGAIFTPLFTLALLFGIIVLLTGFTFQISKSGTFFAPVFALILPISFFVSTVVSIYISQSMYVRFAEEKRGLLTLAQSWLYVKKRAGALVWRWIVLSLCMGVILLPGIVIAVFLNPTSPHLSSAYAASSPLQLFLNVYMDLLIYLLFMPFSAVYGFYLYTSLKETYTPPIDAVSALGKKRKILGVLSGVGVVGGVLGFVLLIVSIGGIIMLLHTTTSSTTDSSQQALEKALQAIEAASSSPYLYGQRADGSTPYQNDTYGFSIIFPEGWTYRPDIKEIQFQTGEFSVTRASNLEGPVSTRTCTLKFPHVSSTSTQITYENKTITTSLAPTIEIFATDDPTSSLSIVDIRKKFQDKNHYKLIQDKETPLGYTSAHEFEYLEFNNENNNCTYTSLSSHVLIYLLPEGKIRQVYLTAPSETWDQYSQAGISSLATFQVLK